MKLFVAGLPYDLDDAELMEIFERMIDFLFEIETPEEISKN